MKGHIREIFNKDGKKSYQVVIRYQDKFGNWRQKTKVCKAPREAQRLKAELIAQVSSGVKFDTTKINLMDYLEKYLDVVKPNLSYRTYERYEGIVKNKITPALGCIELSKLKGVHIQEFYSKEISSGTSSTTVKQYHAILHKSLKQATIWEMIRSNPAAAVEIPKKNKTEMLVLDEFQLNKLLERFKDMTIYLPVLISATTGMRLGEVLGITWDDIDLNNKVIYVKKQLQKVDGSLEFTSLKTKSSKRKITLLDYTIKILTETRKKQFDNLEYFKNNYLDKKLVICQANGKPYSPQYVSRNFARLINGYTGYKSIAKELNIPTIRFHDLRHTHATLLLKAGINPKVVAERLGHSSVSITLDTYSHVLPDLQQEAADKLNILLINGGF